MRYFVYTFALYQEYLLLFLGISFSFNWSDSYFSIFAFICIVVFVKELKESLRLCGLFTGHTVTHYFYEFFYVFSLVKNFCQHKCVVVSIVFPGQRNAYIFGAVFLSLITIITVEFFFYFICQTVTYISRASFLCLIGCSQ